MVKYSDEAICQRIEADFKGKKVSPLFAQGTFSVTLDYLVFTKMIQQPTKLKIDVDGFEPLVIKGATRTLQKRSDLKIHGNRPTGV